MKGPHRWKTLWIVGTISLHGEAGSTVLVAASRQPSSEQRGAVGNVVTTGASEVKSHRRRGKKTPAPHSGANTFRGGVHAPMSIHQSGCGVVKRFTSSRVEPRGAQTLRGKLGKRGNS